MALRIQGGRNGHLIIDYSPIRLTSEQNRFQGIALFNFFWRHVDWPSLIDEMLVAYIHQMGVEYAKGCFKRLLDRAERELQEEETSRL